MAASQGLRSSSVSGVPPAILATFSGGWKESASRKGQPRRSASRSPSEVLPELATPMTTTTAGLDRRLCSAATAQPFPLGLVETGTVSAPTATGPAGWTMPGLGSTWPPKPARIADRTFSPKV